MNENDIHAFSAQHEVTMSPGVAKREMRLTRIQSNIKRSSSPIKAQSLLATDVNVQ